MPQAGKFRYRVAIQQEVTGSPAKNDFGEPNTSWEALATVWAAVEPISGREFWAQQQVQSEISVRIRIRYRSDVEAGMRCLYSGKYYYIKAVIDTMEYHQELQLMCSEGVRIA
jgi:SPP1 family predicted phage head-tail adaptor